MDAPFPIACLEKNFGSDTEVETGEPFWHNEEHIIPTSRTFIRAKLDDNPALASTTYRQTLQSLPEPLRSQLLYGTMDIGLTDTAWKLFPAEWVYAAVARGKLPLEYKGYPDALGLDIARGGQDLTVAMPRYRHMFPRFHVWPGSETTSGQYVANLISPLVGTNTLINLDCIGVGSSPSDFLKERSHKVIDVNFGAGSKDFMGRPCTDASGRLEFTNVRAEAYWHARCLLDPANGIDITLPNDSQFIQELLAPRWSVKGNKILVQPKDELKEILGRSPDRMDTFTLAAFRSGLLPGDAIAHTPIKSARAASDLFAGY
jgi:hypothetical protein